MNKLPKSLQCKAKSDLQQIWMAEGRDDADKAFDLFLDKYGAKYDKAAHCLKKDREALMSIFSHAGSALRQHFAI